ncbi:b10755cb-b0be-4455-a923-10fa031ceb53 [Sclerotinia trifoliorum]|uniref:B10755cb-b0be-4455-a923-10fa031ceb53 n=1 Tax=Sclerotinia trifoliorum TaxID=28548 RepID=A0A8H2VUQ3_9HELO|nr:b10755cb-b0be-4455-a923-10fa031ceb53 [Sclerotinia trifoliorum]
MWKICFQCGRQGYRTDNLSVQVEMELLFVDEIRPLKPAAQRLLERLHSMEVVVEAPACDVSSPEQLEYVLSECLTRLPPIKGCIQGTMDALFEKMTFQEWSTTISSKVPSTLNLHNLLPKNLDFFILLSSIAGIGGSIGQANYAAGNTFQDALCLHRLATGQRATCIRLGIMADIGIVSESDKYFKNRERMVDMASIKETEFLALLDHYCDPKSTNLSPEENLPIIGLVTPAHFESQGVEVPHWIQGPVFAPLAQIGLSPASITEHKSGSTDFAAELRGTSTFVDAQEVVLKALVSKLARALGISSIDVDTSKPLHAYGVDSLLAVELRNWFRKELGANIAVFDIMGAESITVMSATITTNSSLVVCKDEA